MTITDDLTTADVDLDDLDQLSDKGWRRCQVNIGPAKCDQRAEWVARFSRDCDHPSPSSRLMCPKHREHAIAGRVACGHCPKPIHVTWTERI